MDIRLTNDAKDLLAAAYKEYKRRIKDGIPKQQARNFVDVQKIQSEMFPTWPILDIIDTSAELQKAGLAKHYVRQGFLLNDDAIFYMENRFKDAGHVISGIVDAVSKLKP